MSDVEQVFFMMAGTVISVFAMWMLDIRRRRREYKAFEARLDRHDSERERWWAEWQVKVDAIKERVKEHGEEVRREITR